MEFGEDIVVWILTATMFFLSIVIIISGESAIKFKINTMQQDVIDGIYAELAITSLENSLPDRPFNFSYDCEGFVLPMFLIDDGSSRKVLMPEFPGSSWKGRDEIEAGKVVLFDRNVVVDVRIKRFVWKGLCNALASVVGGEKEVAECSGCSIRFFDMGSLECLSYDSGTSCARTLYPVENRGFLGLRGKIYAGYDSSAGEIRIWAK